METIDIKGKQYVTVNERIKEFHRLYPNGSISTKFHSLGEGVAIMRATVTPDMDKPERLFTGTAYEIEGSSFINNGSYIENCETSAVGRALGMLGIGICTDIASADEVMNRDLNDQGEFITDDQKSTLLDMIADTESDMDKFLAFLKVDELTHLPQSKYKAALVALNKKKEAK